MSNETLDDLELELRRLPGVRAAGFDERDDLLLVQLHVTSGARSPGLPAQATRIVARSSDRPVAVEVVRWRDTTAAPVAREEIETDTLDTPEVDTGAPPADEIVLDDVVPMPSEETRVFDGSTAERYRLLAVLSFPDTGEVEVHLIRDGRRTIGRAPAAGGLHAVVDATIEALDGLGSRLSPTMLWVRPIDGAGEGSFLVAVALQSEDSVTYGLASGSSPLEAAARSVLDALNRRIAAVV